MGRGQVWPRGSHQLSVAGKDDPHIGLRVPAGIGGEVEALGRAAGLDDRGIAVGVKYRRDV